MKRAFLISSAFLSFALFLTAGLSATAPEKDTLPSVPEKEVPKKKDPEKPKVKVVPPSKDDPQSIEDLRAMEAQVQKVLDKVMPCTVCIQVGQGSGSGIIVSADGLVLTAGHVSREPGTNGFIVLQNGKRLKAKSLGRNGGIDSGMMKITEGGPFPFVPMGDSAVMKAGQWCICVGHPGGLKPHRGMVVRVGRILFNANSFIRTDCYLVGGDSGGPLFNLQGEVIGINSRIGGKLMNENMHVPMETFHLTWDRLVKGEAWGGILGQPVLVQSAEGKVVMEEKGEFTEKDPFDTKMRYSHCKLFTYNMVPGFAYTIDMKSKSVDSFLRLEDAEGKQLAENDDGGGEQNSRIVYRPSRAGVYRIIATTFDGNQTGAYALSIRQAENVVKDLPSGKVNVVDALKIPPPAIRQALGQFQRDGIEPFANAHLLDEQGKPMAHKEATFQWKSGKITAKSDDQGQVRLKLSADKIDDLLLEVPDGLKAMVRLTDSEGNPLPIKMGSGKKGKSPSSENSPGPADKSQLETRMEILPLQLAKQQALIARE